MEWFRTRAAQDSAYPSLRVPIGHAERLQLSGATRRAARPEKTDSSAKEQLGFGTAKAVIASRAVTVHASTLLVPSQELAARA